MPSHHSFAADLVKAGIPKRDERGRQVDFHSFRITFTTFLQRAGVDRRVVMEVARHKDSRLTDIVYTDAERLDLREAINRLPLLGEDAQKDAHAGVPEGHSGVIGWHEWVGSSTRQKQRKPAEKPWAFASRRGPSRGVEKWSRGESNPRPETVSLAPLRVCPMD
jgi:hypothetical protein